MTIRSRARSARGEEPETDPRFLNQGQTGLVRSTAFGRRVKLLGTNPQDKQSALYIPGDNPANAPWIVTTQTKYLGGGPTTYVGAILKGQFGSGGAMCEVEFDAKPETSIVLPGCSVNLAAQWGFHRVGVAGGVVNEFQANLPTSADISVVAAARATTSRGQAFRSIPFFASLAGSWTLAHPPFSDQFMIYCPETEYALITNVQFLAIGNVIEAEYTGAQLQAIKNAGNTVPVPGISSSLIVTTSGATQQLNFNYILGL